MIKNNIVSINSSYRNCCFAFLDFIGFSRVFGLKKRAPVRHLSTFGKRARIWWTQKREGKSPSLFSCYLIPKILPSFERLPLLVVGIPVALAIFRFAEVIPVAFFQLKDNPGMPLFFLAIIFPPFF